jgi:pyruvate,water dikinase
VVVEPAAVGDQWNDSLVGEYLWSSGNVAEAVPDVMTPATWWAVQRSVTESAGPRTVAGHPCWGTIGGRLYVNLSMALSLAKRLMSTAWFRELTEQSIGPLREDLDVPLYRLPLWRSLRDVGLREVAVQLGSVTRRRALAREIGSMPARCDQALARIANAASASELAGSWREGIEVLFADSCGLMRYARPEATRQALYHRALRRLVGPEQANAITTGSQPDDHLASLDLLVALGDLNAGVIDRATFARRFGHRGPHEYELSIPRPGDDPSWIDRQLELLDSASSPRQLLADRARQREIVWVDIAAEHRHTLRLIRKLATGWARATRRREELRSESVRALWVVRAFIQRAGEITRLGDAPFFLTLDETLDVLEGDHRPLDGVERRRATYDRYRALPRYPTLIRGAFDPERWAAEAARSTDVPDRPTDHHTTIAGYAGAAGLVEGRARVLIDLDQAETLEAGEILVTPVTNVGWTPVLLQVSAVVTDIGAPLSHAAIVARELGIPAVVGCGEATTRICTGDLIRVDGQRGVVERIGA